MGIVPHPMPCAAPTFTQKQSLSISPHAQAPLHTQLQEIIALRQLTALLQPIVRIADGEIIGHEGLIRGPQHSTLHNPQPLFAAAFACGLQMELEDLCREVALQRFVDLKLTGKLFLNVSPECFIRHHAIDASPEAMLRDAPMETLLARRFLRGVDIDPRQVVIELTENESVDD